MSTIPNPLVEYDSIPAVEQAAGFKLLLPQNTLGHVDKIILIGGEMIQLILSNGIKYRMAKGTADISGDYTDYAEKNEATVGKYTVTEKGFYGKIFSATWTDGEYTFALNTPYGISEKCLSDEVIGTLSPADAVARPNPIVKYDYVFEAEYAVGFAVLVSPKVHNSETLKGVYVIGGDVVELEYANGIIYRIAQGTRDISGVHKKYKQEDAFRVGNYHVLAKGDGSLYYVTLWNDGKFSFSLHTPHGINKAEIVEYISTLTQAN